MVGLLKNCALTSYNNNNNLVQYMKTNPLFMRNQRLYKSPAIEVYGRCRLLLSWLRVPSWFFWNGDWTHNLWSLFSVRYVPLTSQPWRPLMSLNCPRLLPLSTSSFMNLYQNILEIQKLQMNLNIHLHDHPLVYWNQAKLLFAKKYIKYKNFTHTLDQSCWLKNFPTLFWGNQFLVTFQK